VFCIAQLLQEGWRVRTTIRSLAKAEQVRASVSKIGAEPTAIEFVKADLNSDKGWDQAVGGADYVLHVASPVPLVNPKSDDELVRPARDGTLRVLKAARDAGVKRVVLTSSIAAIIYGRGTRATPFTESDWTDETNRADSSSYDRSKTIAERVAWAWHRVEGGALELVAINPSFVIGPVVSSELPASLNVVKKLLDGSAPGLPGFGFSLVRRPRHRAVAHPGDDGDFGRKSTVHRFWGFLLDERYREHLKTRAWRRGVESSYPARTKHHCAGVRSFRPGCALATV
jgi:dihydroflavonol-4-reductase